MTFVVGELAAKIRLDGKDAFDASLRGSGREFSALQTIAQKAGVGIQTTLKAAGTATDVASVAVVALGTKIFKAGAAYNGLQQTSRAALKTLLGGAEAANAQMDKLDAFARNSPFSKAVFIQAQQQLIGFGLAADKVLPTLDAIQNAVAATGGNNETISALSDIIAKIGSSAKITAEDLNMFGSRGIDAATLIGSQMGKTGQQIREEITAGTLDASAAVDALVAGMAVKFANGASGVKATMDGAVDRVKAATRDIGAALAEPFVGKNGGGKAVDWANQLADLLRAVEKQTTPFTNWVVGKLNPAFVALTDGLFKAKVTVEGWNVGNLDSQLGRLASYAPALGLTAGVLASYGPIARILGTLGVAINPVVAGLAGLVATSPELRSSLGDLVRAFEPLLPAASSLAKTLSVTLAAALPIVSTGIEVLADVLEPVLTLVGGLPAPLMLGAVAFLAMGTGMRTATSAGGFLATAVQAVSDRMMLQRTIAAGAGIQLGTFGSLAAVAKTSVSGLGLAMKTAFLSNPVGIAITVISLAAAGLTSAFTASAAAAETSNQRMLSVRDSLNQTTGAITAATAAQVRKNLEDEKGRELAEKIGVSFEDVVDAANGNAAAYARVSAATRTWNDGTSEAVKNLSPLEAALRGSTNAGHELIDSVDGQIAAQEAAGNAIRAKIRADRDQMAALDDVGRANYRFQEAMKVVSDESASAADRVNALRTALDLLKGGSMTAEQAQANLARATLDLKDVLAQTNDEGAPLWKSYVDGAGNIDLNTRAGLALSDQLSGQRTKMLEAATAAADLAKANGDYEGAAKAATDASQPYIDSLRKTLTEAGLTTEQVEFLIGKYMDVPETVGTLVTDNNSIADVDAQLADLAGRILATPDKTITINEPLSPMVRQRLIDLGATVTTLPDGTIRISSTGGADVEAELGRLTVTRYATVVVETLNKLRDGINADGGVYRDGVRHAFANGGIPRPFTAFANGGMPSGVYAGRVGGIRMGDRLFAEKETRREAYISDKPGQENRNRQIVENVADWFGGQFVPNDELQRLRSAAAGPAVMGATNGVAAAPATAGPMPLRGDLYLDSGAFLGVIEGVVEAATEPDPTDALFGDAARSRPKGN